MTYLTDELNVWGRPVERFWEYIKIKRFDDVPVEMETENRTSRINEIVSNAGSFTITCMLVIQKLTIIISN